MPTIIISPVGIPAVWSGCYSQWNEYTRHTIL